jgi:hypothetical protein
MYMQSRDLLRGKKVEAMAMMEVVVVVIISFANCLSLGYYYSTRNIASDVRYIKSGRNHLGNK